MRRKNLKIVTPRISPPTTLTLKRLLSNERGFGAGPPFISAYSEVRRLIFFRELIFCFKMNILWEKNLSNLWLQLPEIECTKKLFLVLISNILSVWTSLAIIFSPWHFLFEVFFRVKTIILGRFCNFVYFFDYQAVR